PYYDKRRPYCAEIFLELGIECDIARVIQEQVKLDLVIAGPRQQSGVQFVGFRRHPGRILDAIEVLGLGRLRFQEFAQGSSILRSWLLPVLLNRVPTLAQALFIGVAVLRDDSGDPLRMRQSQPKPHGRAVVEDVNRVAFETDSLCEGVDD